MSGFIIFRFMAAIILGVGGWRLAVFINQQNSQAEGLLWSILVPVGGVIIGFGLVPILWQYTRKKIIQVPADTFISALIGLTGAILISSIIAMPLSLLPSLWGQLTQPILFLVLSILGISIMVVRSHDVVPFLPRRPASLASQLGERRDNKVILDTNSIIDGRIADILQTGFVYGTLLIPKFVLDELHYIADSPDSLRRTRGRRGLDILTKLQKESDVPVQISEMDFKGIRDVDTKLVELAKVMRCPIVTNDVNLNRVASLQGVRVLNINELANAIKPVVLPGEEMNLRIVQEGKEHGQGVGFLDDGTMVVVEGGRRLLNTDVTVTISRVLQTGAGRMIFAHPKI